MKRNSGLRALVTVAVVFVACDDTQVTENLPELEVVPSVLEFGDVVVGEKKTLVAEIRNPGAGVLTVDRIAPSADLAADFTFELADDRVAPGAAVELSITFEPTALGVAGGVFTVTPVDDVPARDLIVEANAVDSQLIVDPEQLDFGLVLIDQTHTLELEVTNTSEEPLEVQFDRGSGVDLCSRGARDVYCVTTDDTSARTSGRLALAAGESKLLQVEFTPQISGLREDATIELKTCDACRTLDVGLRGEGTEQAIVCTPSPVDFGDVNPEVCATQTVTCENTGALPANITQVGFANGASPAFVVARDPSPRTLQASSSVDIDLQFCPSSLGDHSGALTVETDGPVPASRTVVVPLEGRGGGPTITVTPESLDFGLVATLVPYTRSLLVTNTGFHDLEISELAMLGDDAALFTPGAVPPAIPPGDGAVITVTYAPTAEGTSRAELVIRSNDVGQPEVTVDLDGEGRNVPPCSYRISPTTMTFGITEIGRTKTRAAVFENTGGADCLIYGAALEPGSDPSFAVESEPARVVPGGGAELIRVAYSPMAAGTHSGSVRLDFSASDAPVSFSLAGDAGSSDLLVFPDSIDFGDVGVNCASRRQPVELYNVGAVPVTIGATVEPSASSPYTVVRDGNSLPAAGMTLQPGQGTSLLVEFRPTAERAYADAIEIPHTISGTMLRHVIALAGRGEVDAVQTDAFTQLGNPQADILFLVDNSCSMGGEQASLSTNFASFITYADAEAVDYHIAAVTLDEAIGGFGLFQPVGGTPMERVITRQTPNAAAAFQANVAVGAVGPGPEKGFDAAYFALSNPTYASQHSNFLRPQAFLSIIVVSDQPDLSTNTTDFYYQFFASIKGFQNRNKFAFSAIVGDDPGGCSGPGGQAWAGPRYIDMARRTGGVFQSICTADWARALEDLSRTAFGLRNQFFLSGQPVVPTIEVFIDGVSFPPNDGGIVNWAYDGGTNAVVFTPFATPEPGTTVDISYAAQCL